MKKVKGVQILQKKSEGGMLVGPSHDNGGIPAIVDGVEPIELEGGEFIINAQTVGAIGEPFLHKLNSTQTEYHTGGYEQGQLPNPSNFDKGGRVNKRKKLQAGGTSNEVVYNPGPSRARNSINRSREFNSECPNGMYKIGEACFQYTGNQGAIRGGYQPISGPGNIVEGQSPRYRGGGKVNSSRKMAQGGVIENKKSLNKSTAVRNISNRQTSKSIGTSSHSHKINTDIYGNGWTVGGKHTHQIKGHEIQMNCDDGCHSH